MKQWRLCWSLVGVWAERWGYVFSAAAAADSMVITAASTIAKELWEASSYHSGGFSSVVIRLNWRGKKKKPLIQLHSPISVGGDCVTLMFSRAARTDVFSRLVLCFEVADSCVTTCEQYCSIQWKENGGGRPLIQTSGGKLHRQRTVWSAITILPFIL